MSLREEQRNKVCRILDDVLANRPTERDSLITAVRIAFSALSCSEIPNSSDSISRQAAIDEWKNDFRGYVNALDLPRDDYNGIMEYIDELPSAQPDWNELMVICDNCGHAIHVKRH